MNTKEDDKGVPEQDPTKEPSAEEGNATTSDCEMKAGAEAEEDESSFVSFREELGDAFQPEPELMVPGQDGLPVPANEMVETHPAPPFTVETVVCVEDARQWVELFEEEFDRGWIHRLSGQIFLDCLDTRKQFSPEGQELERRVFSPQQVEKRFDMDFVRLPSGAYVPVRPIRERCAHYKRQVLSNDAIPDPTEFGHQAVLRNCMARRSIGGAFLSLRDEAIYACDYRSPADPKSAERYIDGPDRERMKSEAHKVMVPLFKKKA